MSFEERFPRRELQGPRPTPLKISRDSHRIRKPPLPAPGIQYRPPVIIYTQSPKIIHTDAGEFMTLVQRLTGRTAVNNPAASDLLSRPQPSLILNPYHEQVPNPNYGPLEDSGDFAVSNPAGKFGNASTDFNPAPSLPSGLISPISPSFFLPLSPNIFQDAPLFTPQLEYFMSPRHFLYRHPDALFTPPLRSSINAFSSLPSPSPSPTGCDLFSNWSDC